uniref:IQ motif containing H n=1 Tax=Fundulus heteroclitus TaxID=8078 RepID=A0A3Q2R0W2_FUNHE
MAGRPKNEDKMGDVLLQVQHDLRQLKCNIEKVSASDEGATVDVQALDNAIRRTQRSLMKHTEDYWKTVNKQQLILPTIADLQKQTVKTHKWKPCLESLPDVHSQRKKFHGALPERKVHSSSIFHTHFVKDKKLFQYSAHYLFAPQNRSIEASVSITRYPFTIVKGQIDLTAADFRHFKLSFSLCWSNVVDALEALNKLLRDFAVPFAVVNGERLVELCLKSDYGRRKTPSAAALLSVLENQEEVSGLVSRPGQRYRESGAEAAAICIQSCWRRYLARTAYLCHCRRKWAVHVISLAWVMHTERCRVKRALQARRFNQLENYRSRAQHLAANWKHIRSSKRTIIHIPSLGFSQRRRLNTRRYDVLQNIQISRLCDVRDDNVEVIYVCPMHLGEDILEYYSSLLKCNGGDTRTSQASSCSRRFIILTPEAVDHFPTHNMCLFTLLKYSPRTLKRIRHLIQGKQAYIVGGVGHVDDLAVADELDVPILGPEPAVSQLHGTKSGGRRMFSVAGVDIPPGQGDVYSLNQLHETLAELMTQNIRVQRWLFKVNVQRGGRDTAFCDVCHLSCYSWALQRYHRYGPDLWSSKMIQEPVLLRYLNDVPEWLARYARPAKTSRFLSWSSFLKAFLRQGGVVEAYPPAESVTHLTVDMLLEPGGEVTMLSCGDRLHGSCPLDAVGSTVPQTSVHPDTLRSICMRVAQACQQHLIVGYVSVGLATFVDRGTMEQKVWAFDLDIAYSDHLATTQMLLMMTGGTLNWHTGFLEVPAPVKGKCSEYPIKTIPLTIKKIQTSLNFSLYGSRWRLQTSVSEDLQGALVTFARNLSVIHQEISSSKKQGETNFKDLIRNIEDVLQMVTQNKNRLKDKPAD